MPRRRGYWVFMRKLKVIAPSRGIAICKLDLLRVTCEKCGRDYGHRAPNALPNRPMLRSASLLVKRNAGFVKLSNVGAGTTTGQAHGT